MNFDVKTRIKFKLFIQSFLKDLFLAKTFSFDRFPLLSLTFWRYTQYWVVLWRENLVIICMANCFKGLGIIRGGNYRFFCRLSFWPRRIHWMHSGLNISVESKSLKFRAKSSILSYKGSRTYELTGADGCGTDQSTLLNLSLESPTKTLPCLKTFLLFNILDKVPWNFKSVVIFVNLWIKSEFQLACPKYLAIDEIRS